MKSVCFGLLIVFFCDGGSTPTVVSDYCQLTKPEIERLKSLTQEELAALQRPRKEAIRNLRQKYKRLCTQ
jgi:hypothetical protein